MTTLRKILYEEDSSSVLLPVVSWMKAWFHTAEVCSQSPELTGSLSPIYRLLSDELFSVSTHRHSIFWEIWSLWTLVRVVSGDMAIRTMPEQTPWCNSILNVLFLRTQTSETVRDPNPLPGYHTSHSTVQMYAEPALVYLKTHSRSMCNYHSLTALWISRTRTHSVTFSKWQCHFTSSQAFLFDLYVPHFLRDCAEIKGPFLFQSGIIRSCWSFKEAWFSFLTRPS